MSSDELSVPETHVLAVASHVTSGYVGNTMATFCMQSLGCEVSAIHTVNYSNHVAYPTFTGRKSAPDEVASLFTGLQSNRLDRVDMMLSGYCPSAALVSEVGHIARTLRQRTRTAPGAFFWVLDPVMGDNGRLYVASETLPAYRALLPDADLILPNQFEAEQLAGVPIRDARSLADAVGVLHAPPHGLPHVIVTSVEFPGAGEGSLSVVGSTATTEGSPRLFRVTVPAFPVFFSGTGDMFAALLVARLREAARDAGLLGTSSWRSPDEVRPEELPLAKAVEKVLASMHAVLEDTAKQVERVEKELEDEKKAKLNEGVGQEAEKQKEMERSARLTRAAEVRVVRNAGKMRNPPDLEKFKAEAVVAES